jgi:hypothetical protein
MTDGLPVHNTGRWIFHLRLGQTLQFHITSEQGESSHIRIDGHDISLLLDYLYDNRELIYEATHDQETRRLEAVEALDSALAPRSESERPEPIVYFDDGTQRIRAS